MKIFGLNINITRSKNAPTLQRSLSPSSAAWLIGDDSYRGSSRALTNAYEQSVWVYRAINVIAEQVANIPFLFSRGGRGRESLITSGPLHDFYNKPHPRISRFQYWELRILWLMLRGECFRIPIFNETTQRRKLESIVMPDPALFQPILQGNELMGWRYNNPGPRSPIPSQVFLPEEVWFERLPNPFDCWRGLSPLFVANLAANTDYAASAFMHGFMDNNAENGLIVRSDQQLSDEQREQIAAALRNRKRSAGCPDKTTLLWGCNEIVRPGLSSADLQFLENRRFSRSEICAAFGVPEEIITATEHAKYDVMQGARLNFIENRIAPLCARLEAEEQVVINAIDPSATGWFDIDSIPIMETARRSRLATAKAGFDMGIPFNELNRVLDLGFKPLPWGDNGYIASAIQPIESSSSHTNGAVPPTPTRQLPPDFESKLMQLLFGNPPVDTVGYFRAAELLRDLKSKINQPNPNGH
jgi:phage portal protein BeeE